MKWTSTGTRRRKWRSRTNVQIYGLTGGIASGKSTIANLFSELGVPVIDADQISRDLGKPGGEAHAAIVARFGTADRKQLRELVFGQAMGTVVEMRITGRFGAEWVEMSASMAEEANTLRQRRRGGCSRDFG